MYVLEPGNYPSQNETSSYSNKTVPNYDNIRFQPYRIACKLRHLQKESKFYLVDLFNTIEAIREYGLNSQNSDLNAVVSNTEAHSLIFSIFQQLSRRAPSTEVIDVNYSVFLVYNWLIETFKDAPEGFINVLALKIALTLLSSALYSHKLKYLFTLLSNENGYLDQSSFVLFTKYLNDIIFYSEKCFVDIEGPASQKLMNFSTLIDLEKFLENLTNFESQNELISWMIVYHRLFDSENVTHDITCDSCGANPFTGFRYKCKVCSNYNQCQDCFWTGRGSKNHDPNSHPCKEYLFDTAKNNLRRSFRKSLRNRFSSSKKEISVSKAPSEDKLIFKKLNLSNLISPQVLRKNKTFSNVNEFRFSDLCSEYSDNSIAVPNSESEHTLIEHYLNVLRNQSNRTENSSYLSYDSINESFEQQIIDLEQKNRELMKRICELNCYANQNDLSNCAANNQMINGDSTYDSELKFLRQKKNDLENHLACLQDKKQKLLFQLGDVMKELKNCNLSLSDENQQRLNSNLN